MCLTCRTQATATSKCAALKLPSKAVIHVLSLFRLCLPGSPRKPFPVLLISASPCFPHLDLVLPDVHKHLPSQLQAHPTSKILLL